MHFATFILKNLTRRPTRTALTVLGLSLAVGSMVALLGVSHNVSAAVNETFERRGVDLIVMAAGRTDQLSSELDQSVVGHVRELPGVAGAVGSLVELNEVARGNSSVSVLAQGWPHDNYAYADLDVLAGRKLREGDTNAALLGQTRADDLNKAVGDTVELQGEKFEVVGVFRSFDIFENGSIIVPLARLQELSGRPGKVTGVGVKVAKAGADPDAAVAAVKRRIEALTDAEGKSLRLAAQPRRDYVETAAHLKLTRALAWVVSAVAVFIGVISMLNTMAMSVLERTQEIGILRAVGWPRGRVVRMVLGEAVALGLAAAAGGTLGAAAVLYGLSFSSQMAGFIPPGIAPEVAARGVGLSLLIGLLGGAYPAVRAARLLPTEALRHD